MDIIEPVDWPRVRDALPPAEYLWEPLIPAHATTLVHGPPGCGKSALGWGVANAISDGEPYLDIPTKQARVLVVSVDMNIYELKLRWGEKFVPKFAFVCLPKFNIASTTFRTLPIYATVQNYIKEQGVGLVCIDALGGIHSGLSALKDETATMTDAALDAWLSPAATLLIAHDRKRFQQDDGGLSEPSAEDFLGSQLWRSNATSQIHVWKVGDHASMLRHEKSQVGIQLEEKIKLYIDLAGMTERWNNYRAEAVAARYAEAVKALGAEAMAAAQQVEAVAKHCNVAERTAWRWRSIWEEE